MYLSNHVKECWFTQRDTLRTRCGISKVVPLDSWNFKTTRRAFIFFGLKHTPCWWRCHAGQTHLRTRSVLRECLLFILIFSRMEKLFTSRACEIPRHADAIPPDLPPFESFAYVLQLHSRRRRSFRHPRNGNGNGKYSSPFSLRRGAQARKIRRSMSGRWQIHPYF